MPASDVTVSAVFEALPPDTYTIAVGSLSGGIVNPDPAFAAAGTAVTLTVTPETGYALKGGSLAVNGDDGAVPVSGSGLTYTFTMPASNVTVSAEFERLYSVAAGAFAGGSLSSSHASAAAGTAVTLTVTPETGYALKGGSLAVNGGGAAVSVSGSGSTYTFTMPASDVTASAVFNPSFGVAIEGPGDEAIAVIWEKNPENTLTGARLSRSNNDSITFTAAGYTSGVDLMWIMEGQAYNGTGDSLTIYAKDLAVRSYSITVMVKANGLWHSVTESIEIVE
jgi:hypothetical protein